MFKSELEQLIGEATKETTLYPKVDLFNQIAILANSDFSKYSHQQHRIFRSVKKATQSASSKSTNHVLGTSRICRSRFYE